MPLAFLLGAFRLLCPPHSWKDKAFFVSVVPARPVPPLSGSRPWFLRLRQLAFTRPAAHTTVEMPNSCDLLVRTSHPPPPPGHKPRWAVSLPVPSAKPSAGTQQGSAHEGRPSQSPRPARPLDGSRVRGMDTRAPCLARPPPLPSPWLSVTLLQSSGHREEVSSDSGFLFLSFFFW